jgi:hypothetical protein
MSTNNTPYSHDKSYKRLFSSSELVQQLVEGFVDPDIASLLDFSTLERVEGSYITPTMKNRESDIVWKVQAGNTIVYQLRRKTPSVHGGDISRLRSNPVRDYVFCC